jgi:3-phosphoshikimate 1-carboxyvinyltransferase
MEPTRARYEVAPAAGSVDGEVQLPGSKSLTNRALLLAALAEGDSRIERPLLADDTLYMVAGLKNLGFQVRKKEAQDFISIEGAGGRIPWNEGRIWAGSAGTVLRFVLALLPLGRGRFVLDGDAHLRKRPILPLVKALRSLGADIRLLGEGGREPPIEVIGAGEMEGGEVRLPGEISSQFLSALLMTGPLMRRGVDIRIEGDLASRPYAALTLQAMEAFGVKAEQEGSSRFRVPPGAYQARDYVVEGDASAASYFLAVPAVCGGRVRVDGVGTDSRQGDMGFARVLQTMGARVDTGPDWIEVRGPVETGGTFDMNAMPDASLTLAVVAPFASTPTEIRNVPNLRLKESDRLAALQTELERLGCGVEAFEDGLKILPKPMRGTFIRTYEDHRIAMAFAVLGLAVPGIEIENPGCVSKSFPDFFERLEALTGRRGKRTF